MRGENCFVKTQCAQTCLGFRQFNRVVVEAEQFSARQNFRKNFLRVTAVTERAIHRDVAGFGRERLENFRNHDWPMRARRCFSRRYDFCNRCRIAAMFFVFFLEAARVFAAVTHAPFVWQGWLSW